LHELDGRLFISGMPLAAKHDRLRNVEADPHASAGGRVAACADVTALRSGPQPTYSFLYRRSP
jgi:hypothetical protein